MAQQLKRMMIDEYTAGMAAAPSILFVDYRAASAAEMHALRNKLRDAGIRVQVIKNSLAARALADKGVDGLREKLAGSPAVALYGDDDAAAIQAAKLIDEMRRTMKDKLAVMAGVMDGELVGTEAAAWKDMPTREEMLSILSGQITGVGGKLVSQLGAPGGALVSQIDKKAEGGDG